MDKYLFNTNKNAGSFNLIMGFPACKSFALSSLGYMWLYKTASEIVDTNVNMVCTDYTSDINIKNINAISFSMSFDFDFNGVFEILDRYKIPLLSKDRNENYPVIFAGGPVITTNPEPYRQIFDFMVIGDGEDLIKKIVYVLKKHSVKADALKELSNYDGIYIPDITQRVKKVTEKLNNVIYSPVISDESYFKNTFITEVSRGCMNRCAFCTASYLNLPFRNYDYEKIVEAIELGLKYTNKIALLGAQLSAHPQFEKILDYLNNKMENGTDIELSVSSLRTDSVTPKLVKALVSGGQKSSTIAIEAASERLRKFINKNLSNRQIFDAVKTSRENGLKAIKIYSMIGIPSETDEDIKEFITLAKELKEQNKGFEITFSFSSFVPKPQTPFQNCPREDTKLLEDKQKFIEKSLSKLGISSKFSSIKWDYWQTVLSRGDESLTPLLINVYKNGGKLGAYKKAVKELEIDISKTISGFSENKKLPWSFIENYTSEEQLYSEYKRLCKYK